MAAAKRVATRPVVVKLSPNVAAIANQINPVGIEGGLFHIAAHAFSKITLFFCAGAIYVVTHKKNISEMNGLGRVMPWTPWYPRESCLHFPCPRIGNGAALMKLAT